MANPIIFGKYHLIDRISAGGMAEVFRAKSYGVAGFEKIIVIKKILPHLSKDQEFIEMFLDEARISVSLSHANIVQVIDLGREGDSYFMALEYVYGQDLSRTILQGRKSEGLGVARALFIVCEILKGLDYAHRRKDRNYQDLNIVHCDVSPQNILLSYEGEVKLTDFGISRAAFQSASSRGVVRGKYAYMSPEQVEGRELDRRSDVFSMGIILHELLTGKRLFKRDSVDKTLRAVVTTKVPSVREMNPEVDEELERIVYRSLEKNRDERYQDAAEMLEELSTYMFAQGLHVTSTDLSTYLCRIFAKDKANRSDPMEVGGSSLRPFRSVDGPSEHTPRPQGSKASVFIPAGSGHSISVYQHRHGTDQPVILARSNVVSLMVEWYPTGNVEIPDQDAIEREFHRRFEARITSMEGDIWEVNHNGLMATWMIEEDPAGAVAGALECALALKNDEKGAVEGDLKGAYAMVAAVHAGCQLFERETRRPLQGWALSETFAIPRLLVNHLAPTPRLVATKVVQDLVKTRFKFKELPALSESDRLPPFFMVQGRSAPKGGGKRIPWSPVTRVLGQAERLKTIEGILGQVKAGTPRVLLLQGVQGSGRGRYREALQLAARKQGISYFNGLATKDAQDMAYGGLISLLRTIVGLRPQDGLSAEKAKINRLSQLGLGPGEIQLLQSLFDESNIPEEDRSRRLGVVRAAFQKIVMGLSRDQSLILGFESADKLDHLSLQVLHHLISHLSRRPILIVVTASPPFKAPWLGQKICQIIPSQPFSPRLVAELTCDMLAVGEVDKSLVRALHQHGGGHPLKTREMVAELADGGHIAIAGRVASLHGGKWPLPANTDQLLERRLRWLPEKTIEALGQLAHLGPEFPLIAGHWLLGRNLPLQQRLQPAIDAGVLLERKWGDDIYLRFQHPIQMHCCVGKLSRELKRDAPRRVVNLLRQHPDYLRGVRTEWMARALEVAGASESAQFLELAGDKLMAETDFAAALRWYDAALKAPNPSNRGIEIRQKRATCQQGLGQHQEAESTLQDLLETVRAEGTSRQIADVEFELGKLLSAHGKLRSGAELLRDCAGRAKGESDPELQVNAQRELGITLMKLGYLSECLEHLKAAYGRARTLNKPMLLVQTAWAIGVYSTRVGDYRRALESFKRCFGAAKEMNSREEILNALNGMGVVYHYVDQQEQAFKTFREALSLAQELGAHEEYAYIMGRMGAMYTEAKKYENADRALKIAVDRSKQLGHPEIRLFAAIHRGFVRAARGDVIRGIEALAGAIEEAESLGMGSLVAGGTLYLGHAMALNSDHEGANATFSQALELAKSLREPRLARLATAALADERAELESTDAGQ